MVNKRLRNFLFSYTRKHKDEAEEKRVKSMFIVAYDAKEASKMFNAFCEHNNIKLLTLVIGKIRKTKKNARVYTTEYYEREKALIDSWKTGKADD